MKLSYVVLTAIFALTSLSQAQEKGKEKKDPAARVALEAQKDIEDKSLSFRESFDARRAVPDPDHPEISVVKNRVQDKEGELDRKDKELINDLRLELDQEKKGEDILKIATDLRAKYKMAVAPKLNRDQHFVAFVQTTIKLLHPHRNSVQRLLVLDYMTSIGKAMVAEGIQRDTLFAKDSMEDGFKQFFNDEDARKIFVMDMRNYTALVRIAKAGPISFKVARNRSKEWLRGEAYTNHSEDLKKGVWTKADIDTLIDEIFSDKHSCFLDPKDAAAVGCNACGKISENQ